MAVGKLTATNDLSEFLIETVVKTGRRLGAGAYGEARSITIKPLHSFGHLALYALVEEFPIVLPSTYNDPITRDLRARTQVERREKYIAKLYKRLTEEYTVTKMTIRCLHNLPEE